MKIEIAIQDFLHYLEWQKRYSKNTVLAYKNDLIDFKDSLVTNFSIDDIKDIKSTFLRTWLVSLRENNMQPKSVARKISSLQSFFKFCLQKNWIKQTPMANISIPKIPKKTPEYIPESDMDTLLSYFEFTDDEQGDRDKLILQLLYYTGMRRSELLSLVFSDIDFYNSSLKILGKGNKERIVPLLPKLLNNLKSYKNKYNKQANDLVVTQPNNKPMNPRTLYSLVKKYLSFVTTVNYKGPHVLRHSFATHLSLNGAELNAIKDLLGHSSLAATQVYTHHSLEKLKSVHKDAHPRN